jgi:hypothetical protein
VDHVVAPQDRAGPPTAVARLDRWADRITWAAVGLVAAATVVGSVVAVSAGWFPALDDAYIELLVRDVPTHLPLTGVYSRFGWNHPGPAQILLLWLPYRLGGSSSAALLVATLVLHAAALLGAVAIARRIDRLAGLWTFVALEALLVAAPAAASRDPWNPYVALVAGGLAVVCAWGVAERHRWASALLLPLATLLVQAHAGNLFVALSAVLVAAVACRWWHAAGDPPVPWRALGLGAGLTALMWIPPAVAQLSGAPGRLSEVARLRGGDLPMAGARTALGVLTDSFGAVPAWARADAVSHSWARTSLVVPVWFVVVVAGGVVAWRRRDRRYLRGLGVAVVCLAATTAGVATISGGLSDYLLVAERSVAAATLAIAAAAVTSGLPLRARAMAAVLVAVLAAALAAALVGRQLTGDNPWEGTRTAARELTAAVLRSDVSRRPLVMVDVGLGTGASDAVLLQLERAGLDVAVDGPEHAARVGHHRIAPSRSGRTQVVVAPLDRRAALVADGWDVLGDARVLTPSERRRAAALVERRDHGTDPTDVLRAQEALHGLVGDRVEALVAVRDPVAAGSGD